MSKITPIRCQEQVSASKRSYHGSKTRPIPFSHPDENTTHQCKFNAQYLIKSIDLYKYNDLYKLPIGLTPLHDIAFLCQKK